MVSRIPAKQYRRKTEQRAPGNLIDHVTHSAAMGTKERSLDEPDSALNSASP